MENTINHLNLKIFVARYQDLDHSWNTDFFKEKYRYIPFCRIFMPTSGDGEVRLNDVLYPLVPGIALLIPPFARVQMRCEHTMSMYWSHFNVFCMDTQLDYFSGLSRCIAKNVPDFDFYAKLFRMVTRYCWKEFSPLFARENFETQAAFRLILNLFLDEELEGGSQKTRPRLIDILNYIEKNLDGDLSLSVLSRHGCLNANYLSNLFTEQMSISPVRYISQRRMHKAEEYLRHSKLSIGEIADHVGMSSAAHFSKKFKQYYGVSPQIFRKKVSSSEK